MTTTTTTTTASEKTAQIRALSKPGGRGRAACARVAEFTTDLSVALRRAVPFLSRKRVRVIIEETRCVLFSDLAEDESIIHSSVFTISNARGLVMLDESALGRIMDGILGGDGSKGVAPAKPAADSDDDAAAASARKTAPTKLTSAQFALASRVSTALLRAFGEVLSVKLKTSVEPTTAKEIEPGAAVVIALAMDGGGRVMIALPISVIPTTQTSDAPDADDAENKAKVDPNIVAAMSEVELEIVVELGKVRLPLRAIANLKVGDVLRLGLPLDERARVSAGGAQLFQGRPTASGDVVAVALERQVCA